MKSKFMILLITLLIFSACSTENQEREYEIVFENRITDGGYYNGPLIYTKEREEFERREKIWDNRIHKFYSDNE